MQCEILNISQVPSGKEELRQSGTHVGKTLASQLMPRELHPIDQHPFVSFVKSSSLSLFFWI